MRGYKQQFGEGSSIALSIDKLSERIEKMQYPTGPSRYYGIELVLCLKGGALFGGIIVATALLEIYVRGLVVHYAQIAQADFARKINPERELEEMRQKNFEVLVDDLVNSGLFDKEDASKAKDIYKHIRIPTHHGLPSRLLQAKKRDIEVEAIFPEMGSYVGSSVSLREFEEYVEEETIPAIEEIIGILERNKPRK